MFVVEAPVDDDAGDREHEDDGEGGDGDQAHHVQHRAGGQQAADGGLGRAVTRVVAQLRQPGRGRGRRQGEQGRGRQPQPLTIHPGAGAGYHCCCWASTTEVITMNIFVDISTR